MSDLISRADAIDFVTKLIWNDGEIWNDVQDRIVDGIKALPSTEAPKPPGDSISRSDAKDKAKEIIYSILDDTDYDDIESMAHACVMMKIKILKMFDEFPSADADWIPITTSEPTTAHRVLVTYNWVMMTTK